MRLDRQGEIKHQPSFVRVLCKPGAHRDRGRGVPSPCRRRERQDERACAGSGKASFSRHVHRPLALSFTLKDRLQAIVILVMLLNAALQGER